ncbi:MAG: hypothetical protein IJX55_01610 [Clostridia bacterium]|nr:hypothetical protein [Clostridia bacterium]
MKRKFKKIIALFTLVSMVLLMSACFAGEPNYGNIYGSNNETNLSSVSNNTNSNDNTDNNDDFNKETTISEQKCFEYNGMVVTAKSFVDDWLLGEGIKILVENNSSKDYTVSTEAVIVNNCMSSSLFVCEVAAGKKANETLYFSFSDFEKAGISNIGQIEIYFYVYDSNTYDTVYTAECVVIKTSNYNEMDTSVIDDGYVLYDSKGIKIVGKYVDENTLLGSSVLLYVENTSGKNITVSCEDMSINGYMVTGYLYSTVYSGKYAVDEISILSSDLEENDITKIEEVELKFHIYNADTYDTIVDTDAITFKVN